MALEPAGGWTLPNPNDQQRLQQYSSVAARTQFALSRLLLAQAMPFLVDEADPDWVLTARSGGQPVLRHLNGTEVPLSISHTPGLVAIALAPTNTLVGVDVESWTRPLRLARLLDASMSAQDAAWIKRQALPARGFIQHWTLKEAYLKCLGKGIAADLLALSFNLTEERIALRSSPYSDRKYWYFEQLSLLPDYCISLAYAAQHAVNASWQERLFAPMLQLSGCRLRMLQYS